MRNETRKRIVRISGLVIVFAGFASALFPLFFPYPQAPTLYNSVLVMLGAGIYGSALLWPKFGRFLRALSWTVRLSAIALFALLLLMDVKTGGFTFNTVWGGMWGLMVASVFFHH